MAFEFNRRRANNSGLNVNLALQNPEFQRLLIEAVGEKAPQPEAERSGFLERLLSPLEGLGSTPDVIEAMLEGRNPLKEYTGNVFGGFEELFTGNDVLKTSNTSDLLKRADILQGDDMGSKIANFGLGFTGDVLLDPLTDLSFGAGGIAKNAAIKGAGKADDLGRVLKFAGKDITSNPKIVESVSALVNPVRGAFKGAKKIGEMVAPEATENIGKGFNQLFNAQAYANQLPGGKEIFDLIKVTNNKLQTAPQATLELRSLTKPLQNLDEETVDNIYRYVDNGETEAFNLLDSPIQEAVLNVQDFLQKRAGELTEAGVRNIAPGNYLPRMVDGVTPENITETFGDQATDILDDKAIKKFTDAQQAVPISEVNKLLGKKGSINPAYAKDPRDLLGGFGKERTQTSIFEGQNKGFVYNKNLEEVLNSYTINSQRALDSQAFLTDLTKMTTEAGESVLKKVDKDVVPAGFEKIRIKGLDGDYIAQKDIADLVNGYSGTFLKDGGDATGKAIGLFDKSLRLWKESVTAISPNTIGYNLKNAFGDFSNMLMGGYGARNGVLNPVEATRSFQKGFDVVKYEKALIDGSDISKYGDDVKEIYRKALDHGILGGTQIGDEVASLDDIIEGASKTKVEVVKGAVDKGRQAIKKGYETVKDKISTVSGYRENGFRLSNFYDHYLQTGDWAQAAKRAKASSLDYSNLTKFERDFMKRAIPFYSFMRQNFEFQMNQFASKPGTVLTQQKALENLGEAFQASNFTEEDWEVLPGWMKQGLSFALNKKGQDVDILTGFGDPTSALDDVIGGDAKETLTNLVSSSNPLVKTAIEQATGVNTFTGERIDETTNAERYKGLPQSVKDAIGYKEVTNIGADGEEYTRYLMDPQAKYFLENAPFLAPYTTFAKRAGDVAKDPKYLTNLLSGGRIYERNLEAESASRQKEESEILNQLLIQLGIVQPRQGVYLNPTVEMNYPEIEELFAQLGYDYKPKSATQKKKSFEKTESDKVTLENLLGSL